MPARDSQIRPLQKNTLENPKTSKKNKRVIALSAVLAGAAPASVLAAQVKVTSADDAGPGTFRAAVEAANTHAKIDKIKFEKDLGSSI